MAWMQYSPRHNNDQVEKQLLLVAETISECQQCTNARMNNKLHISRSFLPILVHRAVQHRTGVKCKEVAGGT